MSSANAIKGKFISTSAVEWNNFTRLFLAEADRQKCKQHFMLVGAETELDAEVEELVFSEERICEIGQEFNFAEAEKLVKIARVEANLVSQLEKVVLAYPGAGNVGARAKEDLRLTENRDREVMNIENGHTKFKLDIVAAATSWDKKKQDFDEARAKAVTMLQTYLGSNHLNTIATFLNDPARPKVAWKWLSDRFAKETNTSGYLNEVTNKMGALVFNRANGNADHHMHYLEEQNTSLINHGCGKSDADLLNYLMDAMLRSKKDAETYRRVIDTIQVNCTRPYSKDEAMNMFRSEERAIATKKELNGTTSASGGVQFAHAGTGNAGRTRNKKKAVTPSANAVPATEESVSGKKRKRACFKCGSTDHVSCYKDVTCSHCNRKGHIVDYCFELHPEFRPSRPRSGRSNPLQVRNK